MNSDANVDRQKSPNLKPSPRWWDMEGVQTAALPNPVRLDWITDKSGGLFGKRVLDIGCGGGILSESMARRGPGHRHRHGQGTPRRRPPARAGTRWWSSSTARSPPKPTPMKRLASMTGHLHGDAGARAGPGLVLRAIATLVRLGQVFVSTINRNPKAYLMMILGAEYLLKMVPKGTHDHKKFITPAELCRMGKRRACWCGT